MYSKTVTFLYKFFLVGLLLQFFLQTFVTYQLGLDQEWMKWVWLWKEAVIGLLGLLALGHIIWKKQRKQIRASSALGRWTLGLLATVGLTALIHTVLLGEPVSTYILAFKYDFFGFFILLVGLHSSTGLKEEDKKHLLLRYGNCIKRCLIGALVRYAIIFIKPGTLKIFGYDNFMYEGAVGLQPPAAYYTLINHGVTRNQFLFERPISWGFFLTAFFPLFYFLFLYKKPINQTRSRRGVYGVNILLTFSRAAWGSWIIELLFIGLITYRKNLKTFMVYVLLPIIAVIVGIGSVAYTSVLQRSYSTNGHIEMLQNGAKLFTKSPLIGHGGGRAGPASHREGGPKFNPENQYLQIMIEFGILGFLPWFILYLTLNILGIAAVLPYLKKKQLLSEEQHFWPILLLALSLGIIGLSASGMVLHSFSDRMIVYPLMLILGIVWIQYSQQSK